MPDRARFRSTHLIAALLVIACAGHAPAGDTNEFAYPDSRAGEIARAWIDQFNSGDDEQTRRFEETYRAESALKKRSVDERLARYPQLRGCSARSARSLCLVRHPTG